jgi:hypothetical protein
MISFFPVPPVKVNTPAVEEVQKIVAVLDARPTFSSAVTNRVKKADTFRHWMEIETPPHTSIIFVRPFQNDFDKEDGKKKESRGKKRRNANFLIGMNGHCAAKKDDAPPRFLSALRNRS